MANRDYLFRAKADTSNYDANLAKARQTLNSFQKANYSAGGVIKQMTSQLVVSAAKFASFGAAVSGAMKLTKDAFMASEASVDEWGRTMAASKSLYEGFLTSLNTGDISGFLSRIDQIVSAARAAYDELDKLGSMQTIQAPKVSAQQAENARFRMILNTGKWIGAPGANNMGLKDGQVLTPAQLQVIQRMLENGTKTLINLTGNEVKQAGKTVDAFYERYGQELGMSVSEFRKGTSSWDEFTKRLEGAARYRQWEDSHTATVNGTMGTFSIGSREANPYAAYKGWSDFRVDGPLYKELVELMQRRDAMASSLYSQQGQAYRSINRADSRINGRGGGGGRGGSGSLLEGGVKGLSAFDEETFKTTESLRELREQLSRYRAAADEANNPFDYAQAQKGIRETEEKIKAQPMALQLGIDTESMIEVQSKMEDFAEKLRTQIKPIEIKTTANVQPLRLTAENANKAAEALSSIGTALQSIENPKAQVAGLVMTAIANIATSFSGSLKGTFTPWDWIAAAAAGTATMITTISAIKKATAGTYADGGIVKGNTYSGDQIYGGPFVNAGELVLNRAQQSTLASVLQGGSGQGNSNSHPYVSGEQIYLGLNNFLRRSGRGELITSR